MKTVKTLTLRIGAVFGSSALAAVAGGAVLDVELWKAAAIAGIVAAADIGGRRPVGRRDDRVS